MKRWIPVLVVVVMMAVNGQALGATRQVNCATPGQTISQTLETVMPGDIIEISGTCAETVTITTDQITIDGSGTAIIEGAGGGTPVDVSEGLINIVGAQGVIITGLTVQNGPIDGIVGRQGAAFEVKDTLIQDSGDDGLESIEGSSARFSNVTVTRSGQFGIVISRGSNALLSGTVSSNENSSIGILVGSSSNMRLRDVTVEANNNGADGILILDNASVTTSAATQTITTTGNARDGITTFAGGTLRAAGGTITSTQNGRDGLRMASTATMIFFPPTVVTSQGNMRAGMDVRVGHALAIPGVMVTITDNAAFGVSAISGDTILRDGTTIENNGPTDVSLENGARANLTGATIAGTITCDGTEVLTGATCSP